MGFYTFRELRQRRRQRQRKRHSKSEFALLQTSCWRFFQELNSKGLYLSSQKRKSLSCVPVLHEGDVTRDDSQRRFLARHSVAMLEQCCNHSKQCRNNVATLCCAKNRRCESSRVTSPQNVKSGSFTS